MMLKSLKNSWNIQKSKRIPCLLVIQVKKTLTKGQDAKWTFQDCPKCGTQLVAADKFGLYCCLYGCGWRDNKNE